VASSQDNSFPRTPKNAHYFLFDPHLFQHTHEKILYNKLPEIADECNELCQRRKMRGSTDGKKMSGVTQPAVSGENDIEKGQEPKNENPKIESVPTVESPQSCSTGIDDEDSDNSESPRKFRQYDAYEPSDDEESNPYIAKFMNRKKIAHLDRSGSLADSCSVYLDTSYDYHADTETIEGNDHSPFSKTKISVTSTHEEEETLDYSLETMETNRTTYTKETFSSFARPELAALTQSQTLTQTSMDETTTNCLDANKFNISLFSKYMCNNSTMASSCYSGQTPRMEVSEPVSNDSFSPIAQRNVTFSSHLLDDATTNCFDCSEEISLKQSEDLMAVAREARRLRKPKITIVTNNKSLLCMDSSSSSDEDDSDGADDTDKLGLNKKEENVVSEITPSTVAMTPMWSPSSESLSQPSDESFNNYNDTSLDTSCEEGEDVRNTKDLASHNVHVCKSSVCAACRNPQQNTPTFVKTTSTVGSGCSLPRTLSSRWWDVQPQDYANLKNYVSSVLLSGTRHAKRLDEEHPFDEM